jgi:iron complex outermembrane recepter protein
MKIWIMVCAMVCFSNTIQAQNRIYGKISDQDSVPLAGATMFVPEANKGAVSDNEGNYELKGLPGGKIRIQFSFIGYASRIETVILNGNNLELNIRLHETAIETEEIVVTGGYNSTQHENAVKIEVLKIAASGNKATPNFAEVLTRVPGVDMISKGSGVSKPVIRGLSMNDILVLNNGVRYENYQYSSHHPLGINEFGVEDVEIIKGPASLLYGSDAIGGVVNFIAEKPAPQNTVAGDYHMQMFSNSQGISNNAGLKGTHNGFSWGIRAGQKSNADYLQGGGDFVPNSRTQEYSVKTNAGLSGKSGTFKLYYEYGRQNLGLVEDEPVELIVDRGRKCNIFYEQLNTHLLSSQNKLYLGKTKLEADASYQNTELIHFGEEDVYELQMKLATFNYEARLYLPSDERSEYIVGFQGFNQRNTNVNDRETILLPDAATGTYSGFILLQHTFLEKLKLQTGIRYDYKSIETEAVGDPGDVIFYRPAVSKDYGSFSGSIGATYHASEYLLFRANLASAYRTPNLAELTSNGPHETRYEMGDHTLTPENSYEGDLSLHFHKGNVLFDLAGFYNRINNYIFITPTGETHVSGLPIYQYMQSNSFLYGGEAGLHVHPSVIPWLHVQTTFSTVIGKQNNGDYLPFIPAHKLNFEIRAEKEKLSILCNGYVSVGSQTAFDQDHAAPDETTTGGYTLLDFSAGAGIKAGKQIITLELGVNNIFDKKYIDHLSTLKEVNLFNPGRNFTCSLHVPFGFSTKK